MASKREDNGRRQAEGELHYIAAYVAAHEAHGQEHREEGEGGSYDRAEDFARPLEDRFLEGIAHNAIALHVLRDDYRVVDDYADGGDHREERHEVEGKAGHLVKDGRGG